MAATAASCVAVLYSTFSSQVTPAPAAAHVCAHVSASAPTSQSSTRASSAISLARANVWKPQPDAAPVHDSSAESGSGRSYTRSGSTRSAVVSGSATVVYESQLLPPSGMCETSSAVAAYSPLYTIDSTAVGAAVSSARVSHAEEHCDGHVPVAKQPVRSSAASTWSGRGRSPSDHPEIVAATVSRASHAHGGTWSGCLAACSANTGLCSPTTLRSATSGSVQASPQPPVVSWKDSGASTYSAVVGRRTGKASAVCRTRRSRSCAAMRPSSAASGPTMSVR